MPLYTFFLLVHGSVENQNETNKTTSLFVHENAGYICHFTLFFFWNVAMWFSYIVNFLNADRNMVDNSGVCHSCPKGELLFLFVTHLILSLYQKLNHPFQRVILNLLQLPVTRATGTFKEVDSPLQ